MRAAATGSWKIELEEGVKETDFRWGVLLRGFVDEGVEGVRGGTEKFTCAPRLVLDWMCVWGELD